MIVERQVHDVSVAEQVACEPLAYPLLASEVAAKVFGSPAILVTTVGVVGAGSAGTIYHFR